MKCLRQINKISLWFRTLVFVLVFLLVFVDICSKSKTKTAVCFRAIQPSSMHKSVIINDQNSQHVSIQSSHIRRTSSKQVIWSIMVTQYLQFYTSPHSHLEPYNYSRKSASYIIMNPEYGSSISKPMVPEFLYRFPTLAPFSLYHLNKNLIHNKLWYPAPPHTKRLPDTVIFQISERYLPRYHVVFFLPQVLFTFHYNLYNQHDKYHQWLNAQNWSWVLSVNGIVKHWGS